VADHPRLAILKAFTTHLQGISVAGGFNHDLAAAVFRGRTLFGDNDPEVMVSIMEAPRPDAGAIYAGDGEARLESWNLLVQGWAKQDPQNPVDPLYPLLADVEARLTQIIYTKTDTGEPSYPQFFLLPDADGKPQITGLEIQPPVVRPPSSEPVAKACFYLPLRVGLALGVG
jgi:hypothetical protein